MSAKKVYYLFWIRSSKGTDSKVVYAFKPGTSRADIKDFLENWCSTFTAWHVSDNYVSYGFRKVQIPPRRELLKQYDKVCKSKEKIKNRWSTLAAMLNPRDNPPPRCVLS